MSKAIKQTTEKINEIEKTNYKANVYTSFESHGFINRMNELGANEWYDGMTIHPYSGTVSGGTNAEAFYDDVMEKGRECRNPKCKKLCGQITCWKSSGYQ